ncbi:glycosyltransferase family 4 protein [bacterium]|nr:glycosyltransferase family 4 protein [bacterium]
MVSSSRGTDEQFAWLPPAKRAIIHNPMPDIDAPGEALFPANGRKRIVGLARLVYQKGFDLLIPMFAGLAERFPDWDLWIIGEGEKRAELEALVADYRLEGRVFLPGKHSNPWPTVKAAQLFVLPSRFEGLPVVLLSALGCGVPAISFDCPSGPAEIIHDGLDGLLIPPGDTAGFTAAMARLMQDEPLRQQMSRSAVNARVRFGVNQIVLEWEALFDEVKQQR